MSERDSRFRKFHLSNINNCLESAKFQAEEKENFARAHQALDGAFDALERVKRETEDEIEKRNAR